MSHEYCVDTVIPQYGVLSRYSHFSIGQSRLARLESAYLYGVLYCTLCLRPRASSPDSSYRQLHISQTSMKYLQLPRHLRTKKVFLNQVNSWIGSALEYPLLRLTAPLATSHAVVVSSQYVGVNCFPPFTAYFLCPHGSCLNVLRSQSYWNVFHAMFWPQPHQPTTAGFAQSNQIPDFPQSDRFKHR